MKTMLGSEELEVWWGEHCNFKQHGQVGPQWAVNQDGSLIAAVFHVKSQDQQHYPETCPWFRNPGMGHSSDSEMLWSLSITTLQ
jgi:hypothetical protein